jgi:hypothetical protein
MRIALVMIFLAASAFAQDQSAVAAAACGPKDTDLEVNPSTHSRRPNLAKRGFTSFRILAG